MVHFKAAQPCLYICQPTNGQCRRPQTPRISTVQPLFAITPPLTPPIVHGLVDRDASVPHHMVGLACNTLDLKAYPESCKATLHIVIAWPAQPANSMKRGKCAVGSTMGKLPLPLPLSSPLPTSLPLCVFHLPLYPSLTLSSLPPSLPLSSTLL
jgi:hypothetical protein